MQKLQKRENFTNLQVRQAFVSNDQLLEQIIQHFLPRASSFLTKNGATKEQAEDIFYTALKSIYLDFQRSDFELKTDFIYYLLTICRFQWSTICRRKKFKSEVTLDDEKILTIEDTQILQLNTTERFELVQEKIKMLGEQCQKLLYKNITEEKNFKTIALEMNYADATSARQQKFKCLNKLKKLVRRDSRFEELK